jgi:hypothetical protein
MTRAHDRQKTLPQRRCTSCAVCKIPSASCTLRTPICRHFAVAAAFAASRARPCSASLQPWYEPYYCTPARRAYLYPSAGTTGLTQGPAFVRAFAMYSPFTRRARPATGALRRRCLACGPSWYSSLAPERERLHLGLHPSIMVYRGG